RGRSQAGAIASALDELRRLESEGWTLSTRQMLSGLDEGAWAYSTGFAHDVDIVGVFEAPDHSTAFEGVTRLESAGWAEIVSTDWLIGPREFAPVRSPRAQGVERGWGFLALWRCND